ncbi:MAG: hypothetical protein ACFFAU_09090 [Candidatus Hodarchaeota archaeon]
MVTRVHFCARCQRPIRTRRKYCPDCEAFLSSHIMRTPRCSNCTRTAQGAGHLYWNQKLKKIYCMTCINILRTELAKKGFLEAQIHKIIRDDFRPLTF